MPWQQLSLLTTAEHADALSDAFMVFGAVATTYLDAQDQPIYEPAPGTMPLWQEIKFAILFEEAADLTPVLAFCQSNPFIQEPRVAVLADQDWERAWMDDFKPMQFGQRIWICPSWCAPPEPEAVNILLDPGLAFGTGTHPTTAMCLEALDALDLSGKTLIDYGCGSGVLGIAAMKLGAKTVWSVDNDPQALIATKANLEKNGLSTDNFHVEGSGSFEPIKADVVVANILANPLIALSDLLLSLCQDQLILSGILPEQAEEIEALYGRKVYFYPKNQQDGWICCTGTLKN